MKTSYLFLLGFGLFMLTAQAQNRSITFEHGTFKEIKEKALKENKLIFIDAYTTWCGPCKYLSKYIFTNDTVADYYNTNFINAKFDMEKGEGIAMAKLYQVSCYPSLLFVDGNGNLVHRTAGSMLASAFVTLGKTANEPQKNFSYFKTNYETKKKDPEFLMQYIDMISGTCLEPDAEVAYYFSVQKDADLSNEQNWNMIDRYTKHIDSREFNYLIANKAKFESLYTSEKVNKKIATTATASLQEAARTTPFNKATYDDTKAKITALNLASGKESIFSVELELAKKNKDWKTYSELALANTDTYYSKNTEELNSIAWDFYENITDKNALLKAEDWAKQSVELEPSYPNLDTYASLLYKNGKKELAQSTASKAIEYAKKEGYSADDYKSTNELLNKIKLMK